MCPIWILDGRLVSMDSQDFWLDESVAVDCEDIEDRLPETDFAVAI